MNENSEPNFDGIWEKAVSAGKLAAENCQAKYIRAHDPFTGKLYPPFAICGFAWVNVTPGTCKFSRWLKEMGYGKSDHSMGGVSIWISDYNQSHDHKYAYAKAMAKIFNEAGITAEACERLD